MVKILGHQLCREKKMSHSAEESHSAHNSTFLHSIPKSRVFQKTSKNVILIQFDFYSTYTVLGSWCFFSACKQFTCRIVLMGTNDSLQEILLCKHARKLLVCLVRCSFYDLLIKVCIIKYFQRYDRAKKFAIVSQNLKESKQPCVGCTCLQSQHLEGRDRWICESEAHLVYQKSSKTTRKSQKDLVSQ